MRLGHLFLFIFYNTIDHWRSLRVCCGTTNKVAKKRKIFITIYEIIRVVSEFRSSTLLLRLRLLVRIAVLC